MSLFAFPTCSTALTRSQSYHRGHQWYKCGAGIAHKRTVKTAAKVGNAVPRAPAPEAALTQNRGVAEIPVSAPGPARKQQGGGCPRGSSLAQIQQEMDRPRSK